MSNLIKKVSIHNPENLNFILGQSHFIKTVEDLHEVLVTTLPHVKFGLAFAEASGPCLIRTSGTDQTLIELASTNLLQIGAGHSFIIFLKDSFPINFLNNIKNVPEVCRIFCATANPTQIITYKTEQGKAIIGVVDGHSPKGIEKEDDKKERKNFLRKIGYKLA